MCQKGLVFAKQILYNDNWSVGEDIFCLFIFFPLNYTKFLFYERGGVSVVRLKRKVKDRARTFELVAWSDNPHFYEIIDYLKDLSDSVYMYHDRDIVTEETLQHYAEVGQTFPLGLGELKTPHIHAVFRYPNARYTKAVREEFAAFGCDCVFPVESKRGALRYLTHIDYEDKFQYPQSEVHGFGKMSDEFKKAMQDDIDFNVRVIQVLSLIDSYEIVVSKRDFVEDVCNADLFPTVVQMKGWAFAVLEERNEKILKDNLRKKGIEV